jgi:hypothetical protein
VSLAALETERAPDYIQAVVGWRFWDAVETDGVVSLSSPYFPTVWPAGEPLRAECVTRPLRRWILRRFGGEPHAAPTERCSCGIYALAGKAFRDMVWDLGQCPVVGRVSLWGEVHEHEHGWRASFAYPERLYVARRANARGALPPRAPPGRPARRGAARGGSSRASGGTGRRSRPFRSRARSFRMRSAS